MDVVPEEGKPGALRPTLRGGQVGERLSRRTASLHEPSGGRSTHLRKFWCRVHGARSGGTSCRYSARSATLGIKGVGVHILFGAQGRSIFQTCQRIRSSFPEKGD